MNAIENGAAQAGNPIQTEAQPPAEQALVVEPETVAAVEDTQPAKPIVESVVQPETTPAEPIEEADPPIQVKVEKKKKRRKPSGKKSEKDRPWLTEKNKRHQHNMSIAQGLIFRHKGGVMYKHGPKQKSKRKNP